MSQSIKDKSLVRLSGAEGEYQGTLEKENFTFSVTDAETGSAIPCKAEVRPANLPAYVPPNCDFSGGFHLVDDKNLHWARMGEGAGAWRSVRVAISPCTGVDLSIRLERLVVTHSGAPEEFPADSCVRLDAGECRAFQCQLAPDETRAFTVEDRAGNLALADVDVLAGAPTKRGKGDLRITWGSDASMTADTTWVASAQGKFELRPVYRLKNHSDSEHSIIVYVRRPVSGPIVTTTNVADARGLPLLTDGSEIVLGSQPIAFRWHSKPRKNQYGVKSDIRRFTVKNGDGGPAPFWMLVTPQEKLLVREPPRSSLTLGIIEQFAGWRVVDSQGGRSWATGGYLDNLTDLEVMFVVYLFPRLPAARDL